MTAGDFSGDNNTVANGASVNLRPASSGIVWMIKEIGVEGGWELHSYDGSHDFIVYSSSTATTLANREFIATYTDYYYLKNVSGASADYSYKYIVVQ